MINFKFNAKQVFLTYPKCSLSKEFVLEGLKQIADVQDYTVASEKHEDQTDHIHAVICYTNKVHTTNSRIFDLENFHPNIKTLKTKADFVRATKYVKKDGSFVSNVCDKLTPNQQLAQDLLIYGLTPKLVHDHPQVMFKNFNSIRAWVNFIQPTCSLPLSTRKLRHILLHGPSNTGKTTWLSAIKDSFQAYEIPSNNDYSHVCLDVEILFSDEYRGFLTVQDLNKICDGDTIVNTKGGSLKLPITTVVIVSNFSISEVYSKVSNQILDTLYNRFNQYDSSISLPRFPKFII